MEPPQLPSRGTRCRGACARGSAGSRCLLQAAEETPKGAEAGNSSLVGC